MKRWIVAGVFALNLSCGQDHDHRQPIGNDNSDMSLAPDPTLSCTGLAEDAGSYYNVVAYQGGNGTYNRVVVQHRGLEQSSPADLIADLSHYIDVTPRAPTDVRFQFIFSESEPKVGSYSVVLMEGGFTDMATAQVRQMQEVDTMSLASLTCLKI